MQRAGRGRTMAEGSFSSRLTEQRKQKGITQKQASKDFGISQALLSHYERGIREPGLEFVVRAAEYYGVSCDYLLGYTNNSLRLEALPEIRDIPEDDLLTNGTILRANLSVVGKLLKDEPLMDYVRQQFALTTYMLLCAAVKRGILPGTWLQPLSVNDEQYKFLAGTLVNQLDGLDQVDRRPRQQSCPACIRTICTWVNDLLNERIADLM